LSIHLLQCFKNGPLKIKEYFFIVFYYRFTKSLWSIGINMRLLDDKVAIITGAASGIGRAITLVYAKEEAIISIGDINLEGANSVVDEIERLEGRAIAVKTDLSNSSEVKRLVNTTIQEFGEINILVNHAAIVGEHPLPV